MTSRTLLCVFLVFALLMDAVDPARLREFNAKNEVVESFCDVCIATMIGVVYDVVQFEKLLLRQVESRCLRYFGGDEALERHCVEVLSRGVIKVLHRLESRLNPNKICSEFRFCFAKGNEFL